MTDIRKMNGVTRLPPLPQTAQICLTMWLQNVKIKERNYLLKGKNTMLNLTLFLNSFLSYLLLFLIFVILAVAAVFIGIALQKRKNIAEAEAKAAEEETASTETE